MADGQRVEWKNQKGDGVRRLGTLWVQWLSAAPLGWLLLLSLSLLMALLFAQPRLHFSNDRTRLLDAENPAQRRFEVYRRHFGAQPDVVVLVHGAERSRRLAALEALQSGLQQTEGLHSVQAFLPMPDLPGQGLYYLESQELSKLQQQLETFAPQLSHRWLDLRNLNSEDEVADCLLEALRSRGQEPYQSPFGASPPKLEPLQELQLAPDTSVVLAAVQEGVASELLLTTLQGQLQALKPEFPDLEFTLAGDFVVIADDSAWARRSALQAAFLSVFLVHFFFRFSFGQSRPPRMALLSVLVALGWTSAWAALMCPTLNVITINFACTLVGLGMDFNVHLLYDLEEQSRQKARQEALVHSLTHIGGENLLGALATSAAFFSLTLTPFRGIAELGTISGMGVLLCWLSSVTFLPILWWIWPPTSRERPPSLWLKWEQGWRRRPRLVLGGALALTLGALGAAGKPAFDYNLLNVLARDSAASQIDRCFHRQLGTCSLYAVSLAPNEEEMRERQRQFEAFPEVARVESAGRWIPSAAQIGQARPRVQAILQTVESLRVPPPPPARLSSQQLLDLRQRFSGGWPELEALLATMGPGNIQDGLSFFFSELHRDLENRIHWLKTQKADPPPDWSQVPAELLARYRSPEGVWLLKIYSRDHLWEREALLRFQQRLAQVDDQITGMPDLTLAYLEEIHRSYWEAGRNALLAIVVLLTLYFRNLFHVLLALAPKLLGMLWMLGVMGWLGIDFNPANATVLPLTLGIGLVFGVHVLHQAIRKPQQMVFAGPTGRAVAVSGLSTVMGYASLMTTPYQGMASLGLLMAVGILSNLVSALIVLPVLLDQLGRGTSQQSS